MQLYVRATGLLEGWDSLTTRHAGITNEGVRVQIRMLEPSASAEIVNRVWDGSRFIREFAPPNFAPIVGEVHDETHGRGVVTMDMPGHPLARINEPLPDEAVALLLLEGARTLEAIYGLRDPETGELMMPSIRALDPRSILLSHTGRVTFTNLDSLLVRWTARRSDTRRAGAPLLARETPEHRDNLGWSPATGVYLLGCRVAEAMIGDGVCNDGAPPLPEGTRHDHDAAWAANLGGLRRDPALCELLAGTLRANPLARLPPAVIMEGAEAYLASRRAALRDWVCRLPMEPAHEPSSLDGRWLAVNGFETLSVVRPEPTEAVSSEPSIRPPVPLRVSVAPAVLARQQSWCIGKELPDSVADEMTRRTRRSARSAAEAETARITPGDRANTSGGPRPKEVGSPGLSVAAGDRADSRSADTKPTINVVEKRRPAAPPLPSVIESRRPEPVPVERPPLKVAELPPSRTAATRVHVKRASAWTPILAVLFGVIGVTLAFLLILGVALWFE